MCAHLHERVRAWVCVSIYMCVRVSASAIVWACVSAFECESVQVCIPMCVQICEGDCLRFLYRSIFCRQLLAATAGEG